MRNNAPASQIWLSGILAVLFTAPALHSQTVQWVRQFGTPAEDRIAGMGTDPSGNIYLGGSTSAAWPGQVNAGNDDVFISKFDASGTALWTRQFGSSGTDTLTGLSVDFTGNVYVVGAAEGILPGQSTVSDRAFYKPEVRSGPFISKYDKDGNVQWTLRYTELFSSGPFSFAGVEQDNARAVWVLLNTSSNGTVFTGLIKLSSQGTFLGKGVGSNVINSAGRALTIDPAGFPYIAGATVGTRPPVPFVTKASSAVVAANPGTEAIWFQSLQGDLLYRPESAEDVFADPAGNVYVIGLGKHTDLRQSGYLRSYDTNGGQRWTNVLQENNSAFRAGVADNSGVYVTGLLDSNPGSFVRKYSQGGAEIWTRLTGPDGLGVPSAIAFGGLGTTVVAGTAALAPDDLFLIKFANDTVPLSLTCSANPKTLWPPNGKPVAVTVSGKIAGGAPSFLPNSLTYGVTDEYTEFQPNGTGMFPANGSYSLQLPLIAQRKGNDKDGRAYTIVVSGKDNAGSTVSCSTVVTVPHDNSAK